MGENGQILKIQWGKRGALLALPSLMGKGGTIFNSNLGGGGDLGGNYDFISISILRTQRKSIFRYDSAKLKLQFKNNGNRTIDPWKIANWDNCPPNYSTWKIHT